MDHFANSPVMSSYLVAYHLIQWGSRQVKTGKLFQTTSVGNAVYTLLGLRTRLPSNDHIRMSHTYDSYIAFTLIIFNCKMIY